MSKWDRLVVDRSATEAAMAVGGAWTTFVLALAFLEPGMGPLDVGVGSLVGAGLVLVGFAAASRVRPMATREGGERGRLVIRSLALGALIGVANLAMNRGMAAVDPSIHILLAERLSQIPLLTSSFAAPVVEEVAFRLFFLSVLAVAIGRFIDDPGVVFWSALTVSAIVFGLGHVLRPMPESLDLVWVYGTGITVKSSLGGFLIGWVFWRWGLGYAIACHAAANTAHTILEPLVLGL